MIRQFSFRRIAFLSLFDWLASLGAYYAAAAVRVRIGSLPDPLIQFLQYLAIPIDPNWGAGSTGQLFSFQVLFLIAVIWPFFLIVFAVYDGQRSETLKIELMNVFLAICVSTMVLAGILFFTYRDTARILFLVFFLLDVSLLLGVRILIGFYRRLVSPRPSGRRSVLVIGAGEVGQKVVSEIENHARTSLHIVGYLDDDMAKQGKVLAGKPVIGRLDDAPKLIAKQPIDEAIVALPLRAHKKIVGVSSVLQKLVSRVYVVPDLFSLSFPNATLDGFGGIPLICLGQAGVYGWQRFLKRAFDTVSVAVGLALLSPLFFLIAVSIRVTSRGPVIFKQVRIGEKGRPFVMYKFRTMRNESDPEIHIRHVTRLINENLPPEALGNPRSLKLESDPRMTRIGKFLRKTSLDELPQLFNVLRGEMSLVGPRPPLAYEVELYKEWHRGRLETLPGITGLWQVKARNRVTFDEMVRLDISYIQNQSIWTDLKILLQTPWALLTRRGAG